MKLQRQHFLLSYLKTLSVGPVGVSNSQPPASQPGEQPSELPVGGPRGSNKSGLHSKNILFPIRWILRADFERVSIVCTVARLTKSTKRLVSPIVIGFT